MLEAYCETDTAAADGASLIYTTPSIPSQLPSLIHSSLGIHSLLKKQPLKHNVIDRDKIVVPPNWDSWGKIRVLRDGFEVESVSEGWSIDLDQPFPPRQTNGAGGGEANEEQHAAQEDPEGSTVTLYESAVQDPSMDALQIAGRNSHSTALEFETAETQDFLGQQLKLLEGYKRKLEEAAKKDPRSKPALKLDDEPGVIVTGGVNDHIGPVQFNMGGIQVDADDMVQRLKVRLSPSAGTMPHNVCLLSSQDRQAYGSSPEPASPETVEEPKGNEDLQAFFSDLMNRKRATKR